MVGEEKLLSVVIPVYNVKDYLGKTLDCIIEQTYTCWELLLVDDGSTDGSLEIEREYCARDERIHLCQREELPKGAPACRNIGLKEARGKYVIYLDSDDIIAPYCFQQRVEFIEANECDFAIFPLVGFYNQLFDAEGMVFGYKPEGNIVDMLLCRTLPFVVVSNIYKRESLLEKGIYWDTSFKSYQDSDYNLQSIKAGLSYKISNLLPDYFYRLSAQNSICKKLSTANNCLSQISFLEKQTRIYGKNHNDALMICAAQIYQKIVQSECNEEVVNRFVGLDLFKKKRFLQLKLRLIAKLTAHTTNIRIIDIIQLLLTPVFFTRFKSRVIRWGGRNSMLYKEVEIKFKGSVPEPIQRAIIKRI